MSSEDSEVDTNTAPTPSKVAKYTTKNKSKVRQYNVSYLNYGFIPSPNDPSRPFCLICESTFSNEAMKPSRMKDHLHRKHQNKLNADFKGMRDKRMKQSTIRSMFTKTDDQLEKGLLATYNISLMIAKTGSAHTVAETLVLPAVKEVIETVMGQNSAPVLNVMPLSNNTVQRRIDEMGRDVEDQLVQVLRSTEHSLQIDESTLRDNEVLLLGYVRFIHEKKSREEMIFSILLPSDTRSSTIFQAVQKYYLDNEIPISNVIQCATDGAAAMIGKYRGFIALMKREIPDLVGIHCVIHRQHLAARGLSTELHDVLNTVLKCVCKIKARSLNDRLFRLLCEENDEEFQRLLLHTDIRWLSKGNCLLRFYSLFDTVVQFIENIDSELANSLKLMKNDIAYLSDIFSILNDVNKRLQGDMITLIQCKTVIMSFISKLSVYKQNIGRGQLMQFPNLNANDVTENDRLKYCAHLERLQDDMRLRFHDLADLNVPDWIIRPFNVDAMMVPIHLQEEFIDLQNDEETKSTFQSERYDVLWQSVSEKYPLLWKEVKLLILSFPTSYLVEKGFSAVTNLLTKKRNRLSITERGDLRLYLTKFTPDISKLARKHQCQPSH